MLATRGAGAPLSSRATRRSCARNAERLRSVLGLPKRPLSALAAKRNAEEIVSAQSTRHACGRIAVDVIHSTIAVTQLHWGLVSLEAAFCTLHGMGAAVGPLYSPLSLGIALC